MKIKHLLIAALAGAALVGCNKEARNTDDGDFAGKRHYMGFQICTPSETKAVGGGFANGSAAEQAIKHLYFFFYKDGAYISYGKGEVAGNFTGENAGSSDIEKIWGDGNGQGVVVIESVMNTKPNQVLCVANCATPEFFRHKSLADVISMLATGTTGVTGSDQYAEIGFGYLDAGTLYFTMTNSPVVVDENGVKKAQYAVSIDPDVDIKYSAAEAIGNPVNFYIERMAARADVMGLTATNTLSDFEITLKGWALNAVSLNGYFIKNIDPAWIGAAWDKDATLAGNAWLEGTNRINWAKDIHYSGNDAYAFLGETYFPTSAVNLEKNASTTHALQYYSYKDMLDRYALNPSTNAEKYNKYRQNYCLENTFDETGQNDARKVGTSMMVLATANFTGQPVQDLYEYHGNVYDLEGYVEHFLANAQNTYQFFVEDGNGNKVALDKTAIDLNDSDKYIKKAVKLEQTNTDDPYYEFTTGYSDGFVCIDAKEAGLDETTLFVEDGQGGYTAATAAQIQQAFFVDVLDVASCYKDGKMWYAIPIEHLGGAKRGDDLLTGNYGVVRNNFYQITLGDIVSLGHGVYDETEPIVPGEKNDKWYMSARVNINAWNIVTQTATLQE